jgi:hypothetical protein
MDTYNFVSPRVLGLVTATITILGATIILAQVLSRAMEGATRWWRRAARSAAALYLLPILAARRRRRCAILPS